MQKEGEQALVRTPESALAGGSVPLPDVAALQAEGERLKLLRDNQQLRAELAAIGKPWWRQAGIVTMLTALVAAIIPATTAVQAHFESKRELAIQESKQSHEIRTSYLDRLEKPGTRMRTLRFVLATTADNQLRMWAQQEMKFVENEILQIDDRIALLQKEQAALQSGQALGRPPAGETGSSGPAGTQDRLQSIDHELKSLQADKHGSAPPPEPAGAAPPSMR